MKRRVVYLKPGEAPDPKSRHIQVVMGDPPPRPPEPPAPLPPGTRIIRLRRRWMPGPPR